MRLQSLKESCIASSNKQSFFSCIEYLILKSGREIIRHAWNICIASDRFFIASALYMR